jgi:hypothetical protein
MSADLLRNLLMTVGRDDGDIGTVCWWVDLLVQPVVVLVDDLPGQRLLDVHLIEVLAYDWVSCLGDHVLDLLHHHEQLLRHSLSLPQVRWIFTVWSMQCAQSRPGDSPLTDEAAEVKVCVVSDETDMES